MRDYGVLLFGYGLAGRVFHAPLITATPGLTIRAIVTSDPGRQAQARADIPGVRIHAHTDEAWSTLDGIDLVVIATANITHRPLALQAAAHGRHMVIDKPIAGTADQARLIADAARRAGVQVHSFQNRRWDADFLTASAIASSGDLGHLHRMESRFERFRVSPRNSWRESTDPEDLGGVLLDFGAHLVDQAIELLGPIRSVLALGRSVRLPQAADDDMQIVAQHSNGAVSILFGSQAAALGGPRLLLCGSTGALRIDAGDTQETALRTGIIPGGPDWGLEDSEVITSTLVGEDVIERRHRLLPGRWQEFYPAVLSSVTTKAPAPVPVEHVIANLEVLDAARQSVRTGERVTLRVPAAHD